MAPGAKTAEKTAAAPKDGLLAKLQKESGLAEVRDLSFDELLQQMQDAGELLDATQIGDGFHLLQGKEEKKKLVGVPFVILRWKTNPGRFGGFVTMHIKTATPVYFNSTAYTNFIVNDGSTGIKRQLLDFGDDTKPVMCRQGLRVSEDYEVMEEFIDPNGDKQTRPVLDPATQKPVLGTTFYIDTTL